MGTSPFSAVVFAGGGGRCTWQIGFWHTVASEIGLEPSVFGAVSAGAAMASFLLTGREEVAMDAFGRRMAANAQNAYWGNLFRPGKSVFPHAQIYREALRDAIDAQALAKLKEGPELRILLARPPWWCGARSGALLGFICYKLEKKFHKPLHPRLGRWVGFRPEVVSSHDCAEPEELIDLILQSSCTPPFTPLYRRNGKVVLDGGLVDNVPMDAVEGTEHGGKTLVLLTRPYPPDRTEGYPSRVYVQPSGPVPASTWDYTSPQKIQDTYDLGRRDGETFLQQAKT